MHFWEENYQFRLHHFSGKTGICLIIETVVFLGRQSIPHRGHRDDGLLGGPCPFGPVCIRHPVYTIQPVVKPVVQPVVSCKRGLSARVASRRKKAGRNRVLRQLLMSLPLLPASHMRPAFDALSATVPTTVSRLSSSYFTRCSRHGRKTARGRRPTSPATASR